MDICVCVCVCLCARVRVRVWLVNLPKKEISIAERKSSTTFFNTVSLSTRFNPHLELSNSMINLILLGGTVTTINYTYSKF